MQNNLFFSNNNRESNKKNTFKKRKENTLSSLYEVEHFLWNYKKFIRYVKLYKWFK